MTPQLGLVAFHTLFFLLVWGVCVLCFSFPFSPCVRWASVSFVNWPRFYRVSLFFFLYVFHNAHARSHITGAFFRSLRSSCFFSDDGSLDYTEMLKITLENEQSLTLSGPHLIWRLKGERKWEKVRADEISLGDYLHANEKEEKVVKIEKVVSQFRNIPTKHGNIVVNGISAGAFDPILKRDFLFEFIGIELNDRFIGAYYSNLVGFLESTGLFDLNNPAYGFYLKKSRHFLTEIGAWNCFVFLYTQSTAVFSALFVATTLFLIRGKLFAPSSF